MRAQLRRSSTILEHFLVIQRTGLYRTATRCDRAGLSRSRPPTPRGRTHSRPKCGYPEPAETAGSRHAVTTRTHCLHTDTGPPGSFHANSERVHMRAVVFTLKRLEQVNTAMGKKVTLVPTPTPRMEPATLEGHLLKFLTLCEQLGDCDLIPESRTVARIDAFDCLVACLGDSAQTRAGELLATGNVDLFELAAQCERDYLRV